MVDKDDDVGVVAVGGVDKYNPIKDVMDQAGVKMPDMVATGSLSVNEPVVEKEKPFTLEDKKKIPLPAIGDKFMLNGDEFIVVYINEGKHRFTCEPCKGVH